MREYPPKHYIIVRNHRSSAQTVTIEANLEGNTWTYGPHDLPPGEHWRSDVIEKSGTLTVAFHVNGEFLCEDTHQIPTLPHNKASFTTLRLESNGEFRQDVAVEQ